MARRRRDLRPEERELWSRVASTAVPIHPPGKPPRDAAPPKQPAAPAPDPAALPQFRLGQQAKAKPAPVPHPQSPAERLAQAAPRMDHKTHKRMVKGKLRPEARLDLHGMTLAEAHPVLIEFILSCHASGLRLVLVITGKGRGSRGDHGPLPTRPGALRHQVPYWLHHAPLSPAVQQVTAAHYRHGGEGAYYVYLRRRPGQRG